MAHHEEVADLMATIGILKNALEEIADDENWGDDGGWDGNSYPDQIARQALSLIKPAPE